MTGGARDDLNNTPPKTSRIMLTILLAGFSLLGGLLLGVFTAGVCLADYRYTKEAVYWHQLGYEDGYQQAMKTSLEKMLVLARRGELNESSLQEIWR